MILYGTIINAITIIIGGLAGSIAKARIQERFASLIVAALGLYTVSLGVRFAIESQKMMVVVFSLVIGGFLGEWINIEKKLDQLGQYVQNRAKGTSGNFSQGFVTSSLLFCVGSMAIMGSLQSGLAGKHDILMTKAVMDGIISIVFASSMGIGVAASSISVAIYQGCLTLLSSVIAPYLGTAVVTEMTATGGVLLIGVGINILEIKKIKVGNLLPAIFLPILLMLFIK